MENNENTNCWERRQMLNRSKLFAPKWQRKMWGIIQNRTAKHKIKQNVEGFITIKFFWKIG